MNTDNDVMWLREVLTGHDPADPGRSVLASRPPLRNRRRRTAWGGAVLAAAAVVAAIVIPVTLSKGAGTPAATGSTNASTSAAKPVPPPRQGYDHLRWQLFDGSKLTTTTDWWWNGVTGREVKTDNAGKVLSDLSLALPPAPSPPVTGEPTPDPTRGTQNMADDFSGTVPTAAAQLRSYLQIGSTDDSGLMLQRVPGLLFQRVLSSGQMKILVGILTTLPMTGPATDASAPDGRQVQVLHPGPNSGMGTTLPVLDHSGTSIVGTTWESDGHTYWQMLSSAKITPTTQ